MKYMLLIYLDEKGLTEAQRMDCYADSAAYAHKLQASGKFVSTSPLHPTSTATCVRQDNGIPLVTDGPFAETREQLGGYFVIDVDDLDEAIRIASEVPAGKWGTVEIRPMIDVKNLPVARAS
ncbi:MAG TPA: YciI family protein [Terriglobales bacterium]|jgi:hypothetical protein